MQLKRTTSANAKLIQFLDPSAVASKWTSTRGEPGLTAFVTGPQDARLAVDGREWVSFTRRSTRTHASAQELKPEDNRQTSMRGSQRHASLVVARTRIEVEA